jgi:hypothetical protein
MTFNNTSVQRLGDKSPYTHTVRIQNQFKFAQHNTRYNVQLQSGKIIEVNARMGARCKGI